jgi:hypothetical protein
MTNLTGIFFAIYFGGLPFRKGPFVAAAAKPGAGVAFRINGNFMGQDDLPQPGVQRPGKPSLLQVTDNTGDPFALFHISGTRPVIG